jgi:hypothetical protein
MSNTLWIFICLVMGALVAFASGLVASSICSRKEDSEKNQSVGWKVLVYSWVLICAALAIPIRCISIIDQQNKEKIEQLTEQIDSLKALHGPGLDVKNL